MQTAQGCSMGNGFRNVGHLQEDDCGKQTEHGFGESGRFREKCGLKKGASFRLLQFVGGNNPGVPRERHGAFVAPQKFCYVRNHGTGDPEEYLSGE